MLQYCYSWACGIDLGQSVVITGGLYTERIVIEYNEDGSFKELPQLNSGRREHGCGSYISDDRNIVNK